MDDTKGSTKDKTNTTSNDDEEEKKSGSMDIVDMNAEEFESERLKFSIIGNVDTILEEKGDGDIGEEEDSIS